MWEQRISNRRTWGFRLGAPVLAAIFTITICGIAQTTAPPSNAAAATIADNATVPEDLASAPNSQAEAQNVRVVRLSDVEGTVQIARGNEVQFSQAVMNMPLMEGSRLNTGSDGRAEIEFEDGSVVRITPNSSVTLTRLQMESDDNRSTVIGQSSGLAYYELRSSSQTVYAVVEDGKTITPAADTTFRVDLTAKTPEVSVLAGRIHVVGPENSFTADVHEGQAIDFPKSGNAQYTIADGILPNGFDDWNDQRDQEAQQQAQQQTAAREQGGGANGGMGWGDLDSSGGWYPLPGYGMVWQPYGVGPNFDPYGEGTWTYFGPGFGYSWVSAYPWGWLPFHCGGWSYIGGFGWGWMPGPYGCGGGVFIGAGYGWYGGGWWNRRYPYGRIYNGPPGYRAPVPPRITRGHVPPRIIRVGTGRVNGGTITRIRNTPPIARFNGQKIAPLGSVMAGVRMPMRNAALYNNYPAHIRQLNLRDTLLHGTLQQGIRPARAGMTPGFRGEMRPNLPGRTMPGRVNHGGAFRSPMSMSQRQSFNAVQDHMQNRGFSRNPAGTAPRPIFRSQPTMFGRPNVGPARFSGNGFNSGFRQGANPGFRGGNPGFRSSPAYRGNPGFRSAPAPSFRGGGGFRGGGMSTGGGGHVGGMGGGGFHGGGMSGGGHSGR
jgi:hypothetical protein